MLFLTALSILLTLTSCKVDKDGEISSIATASGISFYTSGENEESADGESESSEENESGESSESDESSDSDESSEESEPSEESKPESTTKQPATTTTTTATTTTPRSTTTTPAPAQTTVAAGDGASSSEQEQINEVIRLVNIEREKNGLSALSGSNVSLSNAAQERANEVGGHFSHTRPSGSNWDTVLKEYDISSSAWGENIAKGQKNAADVMDGWMNSAGHRDNILNPRYTHIGVGYDSLTKAWVQILVG